MPDSRRWLLAAAATVLAMGLAVAILEAGVAIGHRYTTVRAAFTDRTRTVTRTRTQTRTDTITHSTVIVVPRTATVTATRPPATVTQTVTQTDMGGFSPYGQ